MSYANPTPLRLGMTGMLGGQRFRVAGRVVMSTEEAGETYYWNEYHIVDDAGNSATLVFEDTERGPEWRLFTLFEPAHPMTASEAATKQVGDQVNLDGRSMPVTLVDQSRVCFTEGTPPEGVEVGDVATYFNIESGDQMLVVSWTGDEVEFYQGITVPAETVTSAFDLPQMASPSRGLSLGGALPLDGGPTQSASSGWVVRLVLMTIMVAAWCFSTRSTGWRSTAPLTKPPPPAVMLAIGARGAINGRTFTVTGRAVVEVAKVGALYDRHEYEMTGPNGERALLVCNPNGNIKAWHLFKPVEPGAPLTPFEAAAKRTGDVVTLDGSEKKIQTLFLSKYLSREGTAATGVTPAAERFGFLALGSTGWLMVRWNEKTIEFHTGLALPERDTIAAFKP